MNVFYNFFNRPIPPFDFQQELNVLVRKTFADRFCGTAGNNRIGFDIFGNRTVGSNNGTVADMYARHDGCMISEPNVIADNGIAFEGIIGLFGVLFGAGFGEQNERIG